VGWRVRLLTKNRNYLRVWFVEGLPLVLGTLEKKTETGEGVLIPPETPPSVQRRGHRHGRADHPENGVSKQQKVKKREAFSCEKAPSE